MSWPVLPYGFLGTQGSSETDTYQVSRSLRFNGTSKYLTRTFLTPTNNKIFTYSCWLKPAFLSTTPRLGIFMASNAGASSIFGLEFTATTQTLSVWDSSISITVGSIVTSQVFRDPTAWYHLVMAVDTTQATAANRVKLYINGAQITAFSSASYPALNANPYMNSAVQHSIGSWFPYAVGYYDGYMAELNFVDGQALTPSSFGETEPVTGRWRPIQYSGTYGNNGFYLPFSRNQAAQELGIDQKTGSFTSATGGLPILNHSQRFLTSGVASDSNASSLVLALPLDTTANLTADQSPTGRTASTKSVTNASVTATAGVYEYYGTGSALFNGTTSRLTIPNSTDFQFGTGDFTIEGWVNSVALKATATFAKCSTDATYTAGYTAEINSGYIGFYDGVAGVRYTGASNLMAVNTWYHVAWSRQSGSLRMFVNGNLVRTDSITSNFSPTVSFVIGNDITTNTYALNAYFQDVRIYKGVAKYTAAFVIPNTNDFIPGGSPTFSVAPYATNDSLVDSPTIYGTDTGVGGEVRGNYATLNSIGQFKSTILNGNLSTNAGLTSSFATIGMSSGKWYCEMYVTAVGTESSLGVTRGLNATQYMGSSVDSWGYYMSGPFYNNSTTTASGASWTTGDTIGAAFNADSGTLIFYKNGVSQGTAFTGLTSGPYFFGCNGRANDVTMNFGQQTYKYAAPSGYKALCSTNFPTPVIRKPSSYFDVVTRTSDGVSNYTRSGHGFSPDLIWTKDRTSAYDHVVWDSVRGTQKYLSTNTNGVEQTASQLAAFNSDGYTINYGMGQGNFSTDRYVDWTWDESTISGLDIITFTGTGSTQNISHNLGVAPKMVIYKCRNNATTPWIVGHSSVNTGSSPWNYYMLLNATDAQALSSGSWNNTAPTTTQFTVGGSFTPNTFTYVAYAFAEVDGFSKFDFFTGNASLDGPYIFCGFRPKFIMVKRTDVAETWIIKDTSRTIFNGTDYELYPNALSAEGGPYTSASGPIIDFLSTGFKVKSTSTGYNASGGRYIYAAFAEAPFKFSRAR